MMRIFAISCCECNKWNSSSTQPGRSLKPQKWFLRDSSSTSRCQPSPNHSRSNFQYAECWIFWQSFVQTWVMWSRLSENSPTKTFPSSGLTHMAKLLLSPRSLSLRALFCVISVLSCLYYFKWMCLVLALVEGSGKMWTRRNRKKTVWWKAEVVQANISSLSTIFCTA